MSDFEMIIVLKQNVFQDKKQKCKLEILEIEIQSIIL